MGVQIPGPPCHRSHRTDESERLEMTDLPYSKGPQNIITPEYQVIRLSEGCPWSCPWCREPKEIGDNWKIFDIPEIVRRDLRITDMNLLAKPEPPGKA